MNNCALLALCGGLLCPATLPAPNSLSPSATQSNLAAAIQATTNFVRFIAAPNFNYERLWEQGPLFTQALDNLAKLVDERTAAAAVQEDTIEAKLITLAYQRAKRLEDFQEIENGYADRQSYLRSRRKELGYPPSRQFSPDLQPEHCQEKYRLAWEFLLLRPQVTNALDLYDYRAREAIARIKNEKSLLTLEYRFGLTARTPQSAPNLDLLTVCAFPSEKGLETLLRCVAITEGLPTKGEGSAAVWDPQQGVHALLTRPEDPVYRQKWEPVLQAYSTKANALPEKQRRFLQRINKTLAEDRNR